MTLLANCIQISLPLLLVTVKSVIFVWSMEVIHWKDDLRFASTMLGVQCVVTASVVMMHKLPAGSLETSLVCNAKYMRTDKRKPQLHKY